MKRVLLLGTEEMLKTYYRYENHPEIISILTDSIINEVGFGVFIDTDKNTLNYVYFCAEVYDLNDHNLITELLNNQYFRDRTCKLLHPLCVKTDFESNFNEEDLYEYFLKIALNEQVCKAMFVLLDIMDTHPWTDETFKRVKSSLIKAMNETDDILYKRIQMSLKLNTGLQCKVLSSEIIKHCIDN